MIGDYPTIDGHFWVERDGKIIDPYFQDYDAIKMIQRLKGDRIHLEAEPLIQAIMTKKFEKSEDQKGMISLLLIVDTPEPYQCYSNSIVEIKKRGGVLKFGSMGWKRKAGGIHYEFGGEGWKIHQFLKM